MEQPRGGAALPLASRQWSGVSRQGSGVSRQGSGISHTTALASVVAFALLVVIPAGNLLLLLPLREDLARSPQMSHRFPASWRTSGRSFVSHDSG